MKTTLDHLPESRKREVEYVRDIILDENKARVEAARNKRHKGMRILKIVLFGSFAKGTWFVDRKSGRASDYDLLIIVSHKDLTNMIGFWDRIEDRLLDDPDVKKEISLNVRTLNDVNAALKVGHFFFTEIIAQGALLYDSGEMKADGTPTYKLAEPGMPDAQNVYEMALDYYERYNGLARSYLKHSRIAIEDNDCNFAAAQLHQAAENSYRMFLLTITLEAPATHNLKNLRRMAERVDDRLAAAWPRGRKPYDKYFELLRRAYTESKHSKEYQTTIEILRWQESCVDKLLDLAVASCEERLLSYKTKAETDHN